MNRLKVANGSTHYNYLGDGQFMEVTNALGHKSIYEYDDQSRLVSITRANGMKRQFTRNSNGRVIQVNQTATSGMSSVTDFVYDDGRLVKINMPSEGILSGFYYENGSVNPYGRQVRARFEKDIKPDYVKHLLDFYLLSPSNQKSEKLRRSLVPPNNKGADQIDYDQYGQVTKHTNALGERISFQYDEMDNITQVTDARGVITGFKYNGFGAMIREDSPATGTTIFQYDEAGNLMKEIRENGVRTIRSYDPLNRLKKEIFRKHSLDKKVVLYTYDACKGGVGRLCSVKGGGLMTRYSYNALGQYTKVRVLRDGETYEEITKYAYTDAGQLSKLHYPSGLIVNYHYNKQGFLKKVTAKSDNKTFTVVDNVLSDKATSRLIGLSFSNGLETNLTFDDQARLTRLVTNGSREPIEDRQMTYDALGNISSIGPA